VRAVGLTFLALGALFAVCTLLMPEVDPAEFLLAGLAYSLLLAAFAVGLMLAGRQARGRWLLAGMGVPLGMAGLGVWIFAAGPVPSDAFFRALPWVLRGLLAGLAAYLGVGVVVAGSGWVRCYRGGHGAIAAEPGTAANSRGQDGSAA
jgi:hypothetical protein